MSRWILLLFVLLPFAAFSQQKEKKARPSLQTTAGFAVAAGQTEPAWQGQLTAGFKMSNWLTAIGAGIDDYRFRSIPLFLRLQRNDLFRRSVFGYADAGVAFPWDRKLMNDEGVFADWQQFYTGFYSETGMGYRLETGGKLAVQFSAGYSFRTMKEKMVTPAWWSSIWPQPQNETIRRHRFHLLTFRMALCINHP